MMFNLLLAISCLIAVGEALDCSNMDSKHMDIKIRKKLFCDYDKNIRPQERVDVVFDYIFKSFSYSDENNVMIVQSWIALKWNDTRLKWNPGDYEMSDKTFASFDLFWVPDITLMESDILEDVNSCTPVDCNVYYNGEVECPLPCEHSAYCDEADHSDFPYDSATCQFTYMSRSSGTKNLMIIGNTLTIDKEMQTLNRGWDVVSAYGLTGNQTTEYIVNSKDPNERFSFLKLIFTIKRDSPEFIYQVIIPAAIIILINIFTLALDASMTERWILYAIAIFGHTLYKIQLRYMLPNNGDSIPKILVFFLDSQIITTFLMIESLLMKIYIESEDESQWVQQVMDFWKSKWPGQSVMYEDTLGAKKNESSTIRIDMSRLVDRVLIISLVIGYAAMSFALMPNAQAGDNIKKMSLAFETDY